MVNPKSLSAKQVAEHLGISPSAILIKIYSKKMRAKKIGRRWYVTLGELALWQKVMVGQKPRLVKKEVDKKI